MPNLYKNKVIYNGNTLIDLTSDTVTSASLLSGYTAHDASGAPITGSASGGGVVISDTTDSHGGTIRTITSTNVINVGSKTITQNGTYDPEDDNLTAYSEVTVNVASSSTEYVVTMSQDSNDEWHSDRTYAQIAAAYSAGKSIVVVAERIGNESVAADGYYFDGGGSGAPYFNADIFYNAGNVEYYTSYFRYNDEYESSTTVTTYNTSGGNAASSDVRSGKYFFNSSGYQTGSVATRTSSDLSASGATVTVPAGIYDSQATKSVSSGSATAPATISGSSATVSTGTNTLTLSKTVSVTPTVSAGYVSSGTSGNSSVSLTASVTTKGATTYNTSSSDQTIASGTYLTGTQTIRGVTTSNITADNIKSGVTVTVGDSADADRVLSVTGTYSGGGGSGKAFYAYIGMASRQANSYGSTSASVSVTKAGTYTISYVAVRGSSSGTMGTNLHIGSTTGTNNTTWNSGTYGQHVKLTGQSISANTTVTVYATSGSNSRYIYVGNLIVEEE